MASEGVLRVRIHFMNDIDPFSSSAYNREPLKPLLYDFHVHRPISEQLAEIIRQIKAPHKKGDCCLQVSPSASGDLGSYLDSDLSLSEQPDELQILQTDPARSSLLLRQQPALRVKSIIDKLLYMSGRDQRRVLFSLKGIFQNDKDLVHEFVHNGGLDALVKLGKNSDQNHQNHILRALGQVLLYVDGMNGVISQSQLVIGWLYELLDSQIEYTESNSLLFLATISHYDRTRKKPDWFGLMRIINDQHAVDEETLIFGMTVINKTLNGVPDQDTFFDVVDNLESQGMNEALKQMTSLNSSQLSQQCSRYEQEVQKEDSLLGNDASGEQALFAKMRLPNNLNGFVRSNENEGKDRRSIMRRRQQEAEAMNGEAARSVINRFETQRNNAVNGSTPKEQNISSEKQAVGKISKQRLEMNATLDEMADTMERELRLNGSVNERSGLAAKSGAKVPSPLKLSNDEKENIKDDEEICKEPEVKEVKAPPPSIPTNLFSPTESKSMVFPEIVKPTIAENKAPKESSPKKEEDDTEEGGPVGFAAMLQKRAKKMEGSSSLRKNIFEPKVSEADQKWREAAEKIKEKQQMIINDLDFTDCLEFEQDPLVLAKMAQIAQEKGLLPGGSIPPPPLMGGGPPPPPPFGGIPPPPSGFGAMGSRGRDQSPGPSGKGTLKLHWKPAQIDVPPVPALKRKGTLWNKIQTPQIDTSKLSKLFEQKPKETATKKSVGESKPQVLQVLAVKRSQAINIGLTKLPPVSVIPPAIKKFDQTVLNKEGIEKILSTMMPSVEEVEKIREAQFESPELPLGQAEQFLLSLSEIDCLLERLRLWLFMLDYRVVEEDVAESLKEWNEAMKEIEESRTFKTAMGMLLSIGNAINGTEIKAFQLDFLARASETKDPVHKYTLTQHLAEYMLDSFPDGTDLYSELGAVSRCSRMDFDSMSDNLKKMESDCKACFNYAEKISQKENSASMKSKLDAHLIQVAERIHTLKLVYRTTANRWNAFLLYMGYAPTEIHDQKPTAIFKTVIEFALEYRANREKILQTRKRLLEKRERNKTRGMMIGVAQNAAGGVQRRQRGSGGVSDKEQRHHEMSRMLTSSTSAAGSDALNRRKGVPASEKQLIASQTEAMRKSPTGDADWGGDDELLDGVVRTVTAHADARNGNRRRARMFNQKQLRRTRTIRQDQLVDLNSAQ